MAGKVAQPSTVDGGVVNGGVVNGGAVNGGAVNSGVMNGGVDRLLERFHILAELSNADLVIAELPSGRFIDCNSSAHARLGYSRDEFLALRPDKLQADPDHDGAWVAVQMAAILQEGGGAFSTHHQPSTPRPPCSVRCGQLTTGRQLPQKEAVRPPAAPQRRGRAARVRRHRCAGTEG
ncbi:hypothetical protein KBY76_02015 [Synechococcus sp. GreenBA-s]|nr:hypothetical protein [Synechococcus sp. GreenBA-s]